MCEAKDVVTALARSLKGWAQDWRVRLGCVVVASVLVLSLIVYRYSPKTTFADCVFKFSASSSTPITKGDAFRVDTCVDLELVATNSARTLGLSGRTSMPWEKGMLFDFIQTGEYCMWMKDMNFPLDMVWVNQQKEIVHIERGIVPETYPKAFCGPPDARYVVEVNSGVVRAGDLHNGQRLRL